MTKLTKELLEKYSLSNENHNSNYIKIGMSTCGLSAGAEEVYKALDDYIKDNNLNINLKKVGCLGFCHSEPIMEIKYNETSKIFKKVNKNSAQCIIEKLINNEDVKNFPQIEDTLEHEKIVLRNCGIINPDDIEDYLNNNGYQSFNKALFQLKPDEIISEIKKSGLRGRGGAGFPTWLKWNNTKNINSEIKYIICNGDEGDPGAYMDRSILEGDPHSVIEGMLIAALTTGANKGIFYIRAEYPLAVDRIENAIKQCYEYGLLGDNILDSGFKCDIETRLGAGAFVCGEETALIASVEGKRGYPRPRPPYPAYSGLWNRPTIINNVETLANIPYIIINGGESLARIGTEKSKGTKVFALTGKVKKSGLIEVPMGISLKELVFNYGGGIIDDKKIKAVQTGGPSGGIIPEQCLNSFVSYEDLEQLGSIMGSGGMIVMNEDDCIVDVAKFFMSFCVDESCGKCAPCRIGSSQLLKLLEKITDGNGTIEDLNELEIISNSMKKASLCGLGQTAPNPVLTSLKYFKDEYLEHINEKKCKAGKCIKLS